MWPNVLVDGTDEPKCRELEKLPYLNAVIKESLRLSSGVIGGLLRVVPMGGVVICEVDVPSGERFLSFLPIERIKADESDNRFVWKYLCPLQREYIPRAA
jgi:hypothetical protein